MLQPKIDAIIAGTENKKAGTANLESIRKRRDALAPGEVLKQARDAALAKSGIALNDARIQKINADIDNDAKKIAQGWAKINDARVGVGKQDKVTLTSQFSAYTQQLGQLRAARIELQKKVLGYNAELKFGDPKLKEFYEAAIADTNKMINDLGKAGSAVAKKQEALRGPIQKAEQQGKPIVLPTDLGIPAGALDGTPTGGGPIVPRAPGVTVEPNKGKGRGGRVLAKGGQANTNKFELRIK